jgi:protein phosphatase 1 regulatory subunit 3A/B/C/D/E
MLLKPEYLLNLFLFRIHKAKLFTFSFPRFADILGLDLSVTRVFADEIPKIPKAAFLDLDVDNIDSYWANNKAFLLPQTLMPRPTQLVPIFPQPASLVQFFDLVHCHKICLESAQMTGLTTLTGDVRVLNISFHKLVFVIWTVDNWATKMESTCEYVPGSSEGITDKFRFHLETAGLAVGSRVHLCIRYETGEQEF